MIKKIIFIILLALISKNVYAQSDTIKMDSIMKTVIKVTLCIKMDLNQYSRCLGYKCNKKNDIVAIVYFI